MTRDTFPFSRHCHEQRFDHLWMTLSHTCANCGITYAVHFEHPDRCWAFTGRDRPHGPTVAAKSCYTGFAGTYWSIPRED
jgi:hypothetical protein